MNLFLKAGEMVLQSLLRTGPTRVEPWEQIAQDLGGSYVRGTFTRSDRLIVPVEAGRLVIDLFSRQASPVTTFTRFQVGYLSDGDFVFSARHGSAEDAVAQVFGRGKDIQVGDPLFDVSFVVDASDPEAVKSLLADEEIRKRLPRRPGVTLMSTLPPRWVPSLPPRRSTVPPEFRVLSCWILGVVSDRTTLTQVTELLGITMTRLRKLGLAKPEIPEADPD